MLLWLECTRICRQQQITFPQVTLFKVKKKKKLDYENHFESGVYNLLDKLLLWEVTADATPENDSLLKDFITPTICPL